MDIGVPIRPLGEVDAKPLIDKVKSLDAEVWNSCDLRQKAYDVHSDTKSIVLLFARGWPNVRVEQYPGWPHLAREAVPLMADIIKKHYTDGGSIIRAMVANLVKGGTISEHYDAAPSFKYGHRIHVPLQTNDKVRFLIEGKRHIMKVGEAYEINNLKDHAVYNEGDEDRYHLVFDYVPPEVA
ncbi:MAG: aspartyl/asparaginyl beta-hydroxylase domain-containing protein [Alphaproteobacteria bacterium]|nr:aspartyl/asparaginyl beta-hydroxylase domain-containing protein [Alphaproteobacteria bacterium]